MAARKERFLRRVRRYWLADRGMGKPSRAVAIFRFVTFQFLRKPFQKASRRFVRFQTPEWAIGVRKAVYSPGSRVRWHDWVNPIYWIIWLFGFVFQWVTSRPLMSLGPAVPAILVLSFLTGFALRSQFERSDWRGQYYRSVLSKSVRDENTGLTRVALSNLTIRFPDQSDYRIQQALLEEKLGNDSAAAKIMLGLANTKRNSIAAFWLINKQFKLEDLADWPPKKHEQFRGLMEIALKNLRGTNEINARTMLAGYLVSIGAPDEAVQNLESVVNRNRDLLLLTANLCSSLGKESQTKQWGERAELHYREQLLAAPGDKAARLNLARALILLKREEDAARALSEGYKITGDQSLLVAGGEALAAWANRIAVSEPANEQNLIRQLQLLRKSVELAPNSGLVLESLIQALIKCSENKNREVETLRTAMLSGLDSENLHFIEGTVCLFRGDVDAAYAHLEIASKNSDRFPGVLNNMAVVLYQKENPDYDRALALANAAVKQMPDEPYLRETRGQILIRLKKWPEAIIDLESGLRAKELAGPIHESLAAAYDALGQKDLADQHRNLASKYPKPTKP